MKTYQITFRLNGIIDTRYVSVGQTNLVYDELEFSIIHRLKKELSIKISDSLEIIKIQEYQE
jgi:hypothetical protein